MVLGRVEWGGCGEATPSPVWVNLNQYSSLAQSPVWSARQERLAALPSICIVKYQDDDKCHTVI